jgi:ABC-2 type transport system permease protein
MNNILKIGWLRGLLEIKQFLRQRESVVFTLLFPVLLLFIFGSVFKGNVASNVSFSQYFLSGMIASALVNTGFQQLAIMIPIERDFGTLKRLRGTPVSLASYFIGKIISVFFLMAVQIILLLAFGVTLFQLHLPSSGEKWIRFIILTILGTITATILGIAFATVPKTGKGASAVVSPIVIILQFFSGVFFVFTTLPKWMQQFAALFPLKWLTQGMRSIFLPDTFAMQEVAHTWEIGKTYAILGIWLIIGTALALKKFRWDKE